MSDLEDLPPRQKSRRITRNQRQTEDDSDDEDFYKQEFWNDADTEEGYVFKRDPGDEADYEVDSDFFDEEEDEDDEEVIVAKEKVKKQGVYVDPAHKPRHQRDAISLKKTPKKRQRKRERRISFIPGTQRRSQREAVKVRSERVDMQSMREEEERKHREQFRPVRKKRPKKVITQEQLLAEAAKTEVINRESLATLLAKEQAVKRRAKVKKKKYEGPMISYKSTPQQKTITFTQVKELPASLQHSFAPDLKHHIYCDITNKRAIYFDPLTKQPSASLEAFLEIRRRYAAEQAAKEAAEKAASSQAALPPQISPKMTITFRRPSSSSSSSSSSTSSSSSSSPSASSSSSSSPSKAPVLPLYGLGDLSSLPAIPGLPDMALSSANLSPGFAYNFNLLPPLAFGNMPLTPTGAMDLGTTLPPLPGMSGDVGSGGLNDPLGGGFGGPDGSLGGGFVGQNGSLNVGGSLGPLGSSVGTVGGMSFGASTGSMADLQFPPLPQMPSGASFPAGATGSQMMQNGQNGFYPPLMK